MSHVQWSDGGSDRGSGVPWTRAGETLIHVGLPKTGTTYVQHAFSDRRRTLLEHGVLYPGHNLNHWRAARAVVGGPTFELWGRTSDPPPIAEWNAVTTEIRRSRRRRPSTTAVISAECLAPAHSYDVTRLLDDVGGVDRSRVVITLRPIELMLPSQWQERLKAGLARDLDEWLHERLEHLDDPIPRFADHPGFDVPGLVENWIDVMGRDRVRVVITDPGRHDMLTESFAHLLGLPADVLTLPTHHSNRGLTREEAQVLLAVNRRADRSIDPQDAHRIYRSPAVDSMAMSRRPTADETRITLPDWAIPQVRAEGARHVERLRDLGVEIVGSLDHLIPSTPIVSTDSWPATSPTADVAAHMVTAMLRAAAPESDGHPLITRIRRWIPPAIEPTATRWWRALLRARDRVRDRATGRDD